MTRKKHLALICALMAFVLLLGGVVLVWSYRYGQRGLALLNSWEEEFFYNGKLMISENGEKALLYHPLGKMGFEELSLQTVPLDSYGFEGKKFSYFRVETKTEYGISYVNYYSPDPSYEPFWSVCTGDRFVFLDEDGKKYRIQPKEELCYPVFASSIDGVDPYGQDVVAFSADASYAVALDGTSVKVYQTDPMDDSLRVVDVKTYSLAKYGKEVRFGAFVGNREAYFILTQGEKKVYVALNCATGEVAPSLLEDADQYGESIDRLYAQKQNGKEEKEFRIRWSHLLLGTEYESPKLDGVSKGEILAVSPSGEYAVASVSAETGEAYFVLNGKRSFSLSSLTEEGTAVQSVRFIYDNVLLIAFRKADGSVISSAYKICF